MTVFENPRWTRILPMVPGTYWIYSRKLRFKQLGFIMESKTGTPFLVTVGGAMVPHKEPSRVLPKGVVVCGPLYEPDDPVAEDFEFSEGMDK